MSELKIKANISQAILNSPIEMRKELELKVPKIENDEALNEELERVIDILIEFTCNEQSAASSYFNSFFRYTYLMSVLDPVFDPQLTLDFRILQKLQSEYVDEVIKQGKKVVSLGAYKDELHKKLHRKLLAGDYEDDKTE